MAHQDVQIELGATLAANTRRVKVKDTFRIFYPGSGFTFRYTTAFPFESTESLTTHRPSGEEREATKVGNFPFQCFVNGVEIPVAGEIIVDPGA